jgi:hypothetical protein
VYTQIRKHIHNSKYTGHNEFAEFLLFFVENRETSSRFLKLLWLKYIKQILNGLYKFLLSFGIQTHNFLPLMLIKIDLFRIHIDIVSQKKQT